MSYDLPDIRRKLEMGADIGHETLKEAFLQAMERIRELQRYIREAERQTHYSEQDYYDLQGSEP